MYAGAVFYEQKNLMIFTAAKDLNALRKVNFNITLFYFYFYMQYIKKEYCHSEIDEGFAFKLDPLLGYVELIFNSPQEEPTTGWSVYPHIKPCRVNYYNNCYLFMHYFYRLMNVTWLVLKGSATLILHYVE